MEYCADVGHRSLAPVFGPYQPIPAKRGRYQTVMNRTNQRARRARILASIRRLIAERGCTHVTIREIALHSDLSHQTVYNLVGSHDEAIVEALNEYSAFIGRSAIQNGPTLSANIDMLISLAATSPDYVRQSTLMFMT